jgi:phosphoglycolate phosphatase-like HAD superfamily hydrolase
VTTEGDERFVPKEARIAVFDNDGTLWSEKPMPVQLDFTVRRLGEMAADDASLREKQPYKAAYEGDMKWMGEAMVKHYHGDDGDLGLLMGAVNTAFEGLTLREYDKDVRDFFQKVDHPSLKRPYRTTGFKPMVELLRYLEANGFTNFIASGGDRDFMRPIVPDIYQIPPERIIGSALGLSYEEDEQGNPHIRYAGKMEFFDDGPEKPVRIWSRIGRRPLIAVGNSNGDIPMLNIAGFPDDSPGLGMYILHDDAEREFDYVAGAEKLIALGNTKGWHAISVKNDWSSVFADLA